MQKKIIVLAVGSLALAAKPHAPVIYTAFGQEGPADFLSPRPFGHSEKPWGKKNRRKLGGMKGGA